MTDQLLKRILHNPDMTGRLAAWTIELSQFHLEYVPRAAMKSQCLSDFVAECQFSELQELEQMQSTKAWTLFIDGSSTENSEGEGIILISPEGFKIQQALRFAFPVTNNIAEYEALIGGIKLAVELEVKILDIFGDSQLVSKQLNKEFKAHNDRMAAYLALSLNLLQKIPSWRIMNIAREENQWVDALSKLASSALPCEKEPIYVEEKLSSSLDQCRINAINSLTDWRQPILDYILNDKTPDEKNKARALVYKERNYCVMNDKLYRRSLVEPLLRCIGFEEAQSAMIEVHTGICGDHLGGKNLAFKIIRQGLFWPTMRKDCEEFVQKCKPCQLHGKVNHRPTTELISVLSPCCKA